MSIFRTLISPESGALLDGCDLNSWFKIYINIRLELRAGFVVSEIVLGQSLPGLTPVKYSFLILILRPASPQATQLRVL